MCPPAPVSIDPQLLTATTLSAEFALAKWELFLAPLGALQEPSSENRLETRPAGSDDWAELTSAGALWSGQRNYLQLEKREASDQLHLPLGSHQGRGLDKPVRSGDLAALGKQNREEVNYHNICACDLINPQIPKPVGKGAASSLSSPLTHAVGKKPEEAHPASKFEKKRMEGPDQRGPTKKVRKTFAWKHHGSLSSVPSLPTVSLRNRRLDPHTRFFVKYSQNLTDCECRGCQGGGNDPGCHSLLSRLPARLTSRYPRRNVPARPVQNYTVDSHHQKQNILNAFFNGKNMCLVFKSLPVSLSPTLRFSSTAHPQIPPFLPVSSGSGKIILNPLSI
uniref:Uncharacterized protein LOC112830023 n=1 Tax=Callorhinus ursinus TaxID=34884 RepID=A0A3Q7PZJ4_CALUR|nr:uncharacterized protein LOC112830023 [Callorhinus ursinus]